jgi:L-iditol 2-dehydrogenase
MQQMMTAAVLYGKEHVEIEQVPIPALGPGDMLVRVRAALTCGTDVKVFRRGYHAKMIVPPALFGHEVAGDVVEGPMLGKRIVAANSAPCGNCRFCLRGKPNLCDDLLFNNGAYAEYIRIPARIAQKNTHVIPEGIDYRDAALTEPLACVLKGLEDTGVTAGDTVTVIGLGPIGMMFVILAKLRGARVIVVGRRPEQIAKAKLLGADEGVTGDSIAGDPIAGVLALTEGQGSDIVIEAVGKPETWNAAIHMLRRGGTVNFFGGPPSGTVVELDTNLLHYSELTCKASFHHTPDHIRRAFEIICQGHVSARDFVNGDAPLSSVPALLAQLAAQNGALKTAVVP